MTVLGSVSQAVATSATLGVIDGRGHTAPCTTETPAQRACFERKGERDLGGEQVFQPRGWSRTWICFRKVFSQGYSLL